MRKETKIYSTIGFVVIFFIIGGISIEEEAYPAPSSMATFMTFVQSIRFFSLLEK